MPKHLCIFVMAILASTKYAPYVTCHVAKPQYAPSRDMNVTMLQPEATCSQAPDLVPFCLTHWPANLLSSGAQLVMQRLQV